VSTVQVVGLALGVAAFFLINAFPPERMKTGFWLVWALVALAWDIVLWSPTWAVITALSVAALAWIFGEERKSRRGGAR
jgi:hypothetical protein